MDHDAAFSLQTQAAVCALVCEFSTAGGWRVKLSGVLFLPGGQTVESEQVIQKPEKDSGCLAKNLPYGAAVPFPN